MFDIGFDEMLVVAVVAILVIGPKDLPLALRSAGRWMAKVRRVSGHFRSGVETMIREAELAEMEKKWAEQNAAIMKVDPHLGADFQADGEVAAASAEAALPLTEPAVAPAAPKRARKRAKTADPSLPFSAP